MPILCVGQIVADVVVRPVDSLPAAGTTSLVSDLRLTAGGCAANTASVLAKFGVDAIVLGLVGRDALADAVLAQLAGNGVDTSGVSRDASVETSAVIVVVDSQGERSFMYRDGGNERLSMDVVSDAVLRRSDFVHVGGAMKLLNLDLAALLTRARGFGCTTSLDTDWDPRGTWLASLEQALPQIDYLLTNEDEGRMLTGLSDPEEIGANLLARGPRAVVVKQGNHGATLVTGAAVRHCPTFDVDVVDTTCAGDAFAAGFVYALSQGWELAGAVKFANAAGALCTTELSHDGIVSLEGTMDFMASHVGSVLALETLPPVQDGLSLASEDVR